MHLFTFGPNSFNMNAKYMIKTFFFILEIFDSDLELVRSQTASLTPFGNTVPWSTTNDVIYRAGFGT